MSDDKKLDDWIIPLYKIYTDDEDLNLITKIRVLKRLVMDFSFSDEQTLLQESVSRFIANDYGFEERQKHSRSDLGYSTENWKTFAELGWLGVPFAEGAGGFGGGAVEMMLMMEEFGKGLVVEATSMGAGVSSAS